MNPHRFLGVSFFVFFCLLGTPSVRTEEGAKLFAFVGPQSLITAEVASGHSFIVNFINLSDFVIVVQPNEFIYKGASGRFYIGQVFEQEHNDSRGEPLKYTASVLLKGRSFTGLTIVGAFHELDQIEELSVRIGAKRYYLQPMEKMLFEQLANKIGEIDLTSPNSRTALQEANISELGSVKSTDGTSEWDRDWQGLVRQDGVVVPKIIERPPVQPTEEAIKHRTFGRVRLSALINRNGGIQDLKVQKGLGRGLDERAIEAVKNSWLFLPATKNGEVVEGSVIFDVEFVPPDKKP
jgi:TonB family protein